jgi:hypothetical protein
MSNLVPAEAVATRIFVLRGRKVMLDRDLAELYRVPTKRLNEQVKRNIRRFPEDFMFQLTSDEKIELVAICDRFSSLKHSSTLPYAFTEQGIAMLSSVLNSENAIQVNIAVMRAFVRLRQILSTHKELAAKLNQLEHKVEKHDKNIHDIFEAIRQLMIAPDAAKRVVDGFRVKR